MLQYIQIGSRWDINKTEIERFYFEAIEDLKKNKIQDFSKDIKCTKELIIELIDEIYNEMKDSFGTMPDLRKNLKIIEFDDKKYMNGIFFYVNAMENGKLTGYLYFSSKYKYESVEQLKLKLVHEIYPGHHYMKTVKLNNSQSKNMFRLWKNDFLFEGWAKYCEYYYANKKGQELIFNSNLAFMSLMFILVMDIHFYGKLLNEVIRHAEELGEIDTKQARTLVINAYRDWEIHFNYYVGFNYLRKKEKISLKELIS